jgi:DtxR family transcriptional regulator, Mn-dependent transcriptional regulator
MALHGSHKEKISKEMYLKTIFLFKQDNDKNPKPVDLVRELELSKSSVSEMLRKLQEDGLVKYESYGAIELTKKGLVYAKRVLSRYLVLKKFLVNYLNIPVKRANEEACDLEHGFSDDSISKLKKYMGKK